MTFYCLLLRTVGFFGLSPPVCRTVRHHPDPFLSYDYRAFLRAYTLFVCPIGFVAWMDDQKRLYALYASKNRLCMLCENTTPKKTAYNAYRNENRRVRRAEGMKMYALKDAYRLHTKCIQAYKESKRERFFLLLLLYIACSSIFYCSFFRHSSPTARIFRHSRTPSRSLPAL